MAFQRSSTSRAAGIGAGFGQGIGTGIERGLQNIAEQKMYQMQQQRLAKEREEFASTLRDMDPRDAMHLAYLYQKDPKAYVSALGGFHFQNPNEQLGEEEAQELEGLQGPQFNPNQSIGGMQQNQLQQLLKLGGQRQQPGGMQFNRPQEGLGNLGVDDESQLRKLAGIEPQTGMKFAPVEKPRMPKVTKKPEWYAPYDIGRTQAAKAAASGEKPLTAQQKITKIKDDRKDAALFSNMYKVASEMRDILENGYEGEDVDLGRISEREYAASPHNVNKATSRYGKLSIKLAQLQAGTEKGVVGKYRLERIEAAKPSLLDTKDSNIEDLDDIIAQSRDNLEYIHENNPEADITLPEGIAAREKPKKQYAPEIQQQLDDLESQNPARKVKEGDIAYDENDEPKFIKRNGEWELYNG